MCQQDNNSCACQQPEKLVGKPGECSPKQIKECHGEENVCSCFQEKEKEK